ncbi:uncharacterized protein TNCV_849991 [Trichonephila clavipes]|uniref:Uncharacterized protein n=1 Tax=Trichonephila clavipes TaxID=2585209 RepID=A0A8X6RVI2_TRICX|nr:uncharacterized protein TNCV_849991 [Trichonephila clavipes]
MYKTKQLTRADPSRRAVHVRAPHEGGQNKGRPHIHWCAKIKNEVEKLAYQLNEEAQWTERPIRRLSKVMYGSTCADMQIDVMGECLSSIKHVVGPQREMANNQSVRRHLDAFTRGRIIGKLEEGRSVTSVAAEFGIAHSIVSRL